MITCNQVSAFLGEASARNVTTPLAPDALALLQELQLVRQLSAADLQQVQQRVADIQNAQLALAQEAAQRQQAAGAFAADTKKAHSILFHLEGVDHQNSLLERLQQESAAIKSLDEDLAKRQQDFAQLLLDKAALDAVGPYAGGYLSVTTQGRMALRDLTSRLYRVGDEEFSKYWEEASRVDNDLATIATQGAVVAQALSGQLTDVERAYVWAVAIGLVKTGGDPNERVQAYLDAYRRVKDLSGNVENVLMASEILATDRHALDEAVAWVGSLSHEVADLGVPPEAQLGVAAILLLGERADGTFATESLRGFLTTTPSFESAALLAIQNQPIPALAQKFASLKSLFGSWGYSASEDTELASAYLAASELPIDSVSPKMAILSRGLAGYLQYPLVAAAILASIPVLEANETLNLLEKAYEILGQRTGPMSQAELITLAVRTIHGINVQSVDELDATAKAVPSPPGFSYAGMPPRLWMPVFIAHGVYYSTFSGIGGIHPGHVHAWGGGGFTG